MALTRVNKPVGQEVVFVIERLVFLTKSFNFSVELFVLLL